MDPVTISDGFTYQRAAIKRWLARSASKAESPMTGEVLSMENGKIVMLPNYTLRSLIAHCLSSSRP